MTDRILEDFLHQQYREGMALAAASNLFDLVPLRGDPPYKYVACFSCRGLTQTASREIVEADEFAVGIYFAEHHLRRVDLAILTTWLVPTSGIFHPNTKGQFACLGNVGAGVSLVSVVYQLFAIITGNKLRLDDPMNGEAASWARRNLQRFPVDRRPLKWRAAEAPGAGDVEIVEVPS